MTVNLSIPIDVNNMHCGECHFMYSDIIYKQNKYCRLFETYLGERKDVFRCKQCKEAEK